MSGFLSRGCSYSPSESFEYTALQYASRKGSLEQVRYLVDCGNDLDVGPDPALHLALRKGHTSIALVLLQAGAEFEIKDAHGDFPIHIACTLGLLEVVHTLCSLGCNVEIATEKGLFPLHLAAKNGHINIVRCLCTSGCNIDIKNADNIRADITALKYGHNDIADLIDRLRATGHRDLYARQLVPTSKPALKLTLRLLGHCGVGKSALIKSLNAGLFSSLFRRSSSLQSNKSRPSSPINTQIEMDVTSRQNSLNFESSANYHSTNGIHVQNIDISGVGDVSVWEFSGQESYFPSYHHFLYPNPYTLTAILFNLEDTATIQTQQACFWINFLLARQPADLPTCEYGKIVLVATHVDTTRAVKNQHGEWISSDAQKTTETVLKQVPHAPNIISNPVVMDCNVPASYAFKSFKSLLSTLKQDCIQDTLLENIFVNKPQHDYDLLATPCFKVHLEAHKYLSKQTIGTWTGLLEASLSWLSTLQKEFDQFPVITRDSFAELLRSHVNLLSSDEHIHELLQQLHSMGEVFCIFDLVVISVSWLGTQLIGELLSNEFLVHARVTGVYSSEDFQASYNQCDALGVLELLKALDLCVQCEVEGEIEFEFPIYNQTETLAGLWDAGDPRYRTTGASYGGVQLYTSPGTCHLFSSIFPHIQVQLRKSTLDSSTSTDSEVDLYQWYCGSKLCTTVLETIITLNEDSTGNEFIEVKIRGPRETSQYSFYMFEQVLETIYQAIFRICPGLLVERHILSTQQLKTHQLDPFIYEPHVVTSAMLDAESTLDITFQNGNTDKQESIIQLVLFDNVDLASNIQWGCALKVCDLHPAVKLKLCGLLDPPEPHGRDWCLLALRLGLSQERIAALDSLHSSCTMRLLTMADCSIGALISSMHELDRNDAAEVVLRSAPLLKMIEHAN